MTNAIENKNFHQRQLQKNKGFSNIPEGFYFLTCVGRKSYTSNGERKIHQKQILNSSADFTTNRGN